MLKKSVIIAKRHYTSISIEPEFWIELEYIAQKENCSTNDLITKIDAQRENKNLSSAIRVFILNSLKKTSR